MVSWRRPRRIRIRSAALSLPTRTPLVRQRPRDRDGAVIVAGTGTVGWKRFQRTDPPGRRLGDADFRRRQWRLARLRSGAPPALGARPAGSPEPGCCAPSAGSRTILMPSSLGRSRRRPLTSDRWRRWCSTPPRPAALSPANWSVFTPLLSTRAGCPASRWCDPVGGGRWLCAFPDSFARRTDQGLSGRARRRRVVGGALSGALRRSVFGASGVTILLDQSGGAVRPPGTGMAAELNGAPTVVQRRPGNWARRSARLIARPRRQPPIVVVTCAREQLRPCSDLRQAFDRADLGIPVAAAAPNIATASIHRNELGIGCSLRFRQSDRATISLKRRAAARRRRRGRRRSSADTDNPLAGAATSSADGGRT